VNVYEAEGFDYSAPKKAKVSQEESEYAPTPEKVKPEKYVPAM